jgi:F-type H+-transporting ATPase subunit gamma
MADAPHFDKTRPIGGLAYKEFIEGRVDRVFLAYTDFKSALSQIPNVKQILPIIPEVELNQKNGKRDEEEENELIQKAVQEQDTVFEPDPRTILDQLLPRLLETELYQALLESSASEHSARMMAMRSATDNASDMMQDLTFTFNQARQASITREISEISAGKAAIE